MVGKKKKKETPRQKRSEIGADRVNYVCGSCCQQIDFDCRCLHCGKCGRKFDEDGNLI